MFICTLQQVLELAYSDTCQQHLVAVSVYLQITSYLTSRTLQWARHVVILYCIVLYFKKLVSQGASSERLKTLTIAGPALSLVQGERGMTPQGLICEAEMPGRRLRHICPTQSNCKSSDLLVKLKLC